MGKHAMEVTSHGFEVYTDDLVEIFDGQDALNDIDLYPLTPEP